MTRGDIIRGIGGQHRWCGRPVRRTGRARAGQFPAPRRIAVDEQDRRRADRPETGAVLAAGAPGKYEGGKLTVTSRLITRSFLEEFRPLPLPVLEASSNLAGGRRALGIDVRHSPNDTRCLEMLRFPI